MIYSNNEVLSAKQTLRQRREQARLDAEARYDEITSKIPRIREIDKELRIIGSNIGKYVLSYPDKIEEKLKELKDASIALQSEHKSLLKNAGITDSYFEPVYSCSLCNDVGFNDGKMCKCLLEQLRNQATAALNALSPLSLCDFENFSLDYYSDESDESKMSPKKLMEHNLKFCKKFAKDFDQNGQNILMTGNTGLGKTHLSLSIAKSLLKKDFSVIYGSTQNLISQIEKEHFGRAQSDRDTMETLLECDLLILDDLGTEFTTSFTSSAIYNIINSRQLTAKSTIISTNLTMSELEEKYSDRIVSRIIGSSKILQFSGSDIRVKLKNGKKR